MTEIILFTGKTCKYCHIMKDRLSGYDYTEKDVEDDREIAKFYGVRSLPTTIVVKNGIVVASFHGVVPIEKIERCL